MNGYSTIAADEVARRCPPALAKITKAEGYVTSSRQLFTCSHVMRGAAAFACADHPAGGLRCIDCMGEHISRHGDEAELTCDSCFDVFEALVPLVCVSVFDKVRIREPRGRHRLFSSRIGFIGVGVCTTCWGVA